MKKETYIKTVNSVREHKHLERALVFANEILTGIVYISFPILLVTLGYNRKFRDLIKIVLVCGISFVLVSVFRHFYNISFWKKCFTVFRFAVKISHIFD